MTVKKIALLGLASVATLGMSISMAGGPAACAPAADVSGVYVGVDVGAIYNTELDLKTDLIEYTKKATPWGWSASGLVGYQFDNNWAVQFGYIWNQDQKTTIFDATADFVKYKHYNLYLALKGMLPLMDQLSAYMLVGPAYTHTKENGILGGEATSAKGSFWSPMGAVGVSYAMDESFSVNLQYMFIMADPRSVQSTDASLNEAIGDANTQRITVGANYTFSM